MHAIPCRVRSSVYWSASIRTISNSNTGRKNSWTSDTCRPSCLPFETEMTDRTTWQRRVRAIGCIDSRLARCVVVVIYYVRTRDGFVRTIWRMEPSGRVSVCAVFRQCQYKHENVYGPKKEKYTFQHCEPRLVRARTYLCTHCSLGSPKYGVKSVAYMTNLITSNVYIHSRRIYHLNNIIDPNIPIRSALKNWPKIVNIYITKNDTTRYQQKWLLYRNQPCRNCTERKSGKNNLEYVDRHDVYVSQVIKKKKENQIGYWSWRVIEPFVSHKSTSVKILFNARQQNRGN